MALALGTAFPDPYFVAEVRRIFRDQPVWKQESPASDGSKGALASATSQPLHVMQPPVRRAAIYVTAPFAAGMLGATSYLPLFDPPPPVQSPLSAPQASDGGAGGTWAAASYQFCLTYTTAAGEFGLSPLGPTVAIAASHQVTIAAVGGLLSQVTQVNVYAVTASAGGSSVGRVGSIAVVSGTAPQTTFAAPPSGANVGLVPMLVTSDTGELQFPIAPPTGTVAVAYQSSRYSDQQVLDALYEGLGMLWPEVWSYQPYDLTSVLPSPVQYEYVLPATYADPKVVITEVEVRPPQAWVRFRRISGWRFVNDPLNPTLVFEKTPPAGGQVRITYVLPFQQLGDVPSLGVTGSLLPPANLPVYYAVGRLLADAEVMRGRADDLPSLTAENAGSEKGGNLQTASFWFQNMFGPELAKISIGKPARRMVQSRIVERLGLSGIWQEAA